MWRYNAIRITSYLYINLIRLQKACFIDDSYECSRVGYKDASSTFDSLLGTELHGVENSTEERL